MSALVSLSKQDSIAVITIANPPVNASSQAVRKALADILAQLRGDQSLSAIMICCGGRTFMAGADINEFDLDDIPAPDPNEIHALLDKMDRPVIAVLHGTVLGAGLELALACHYRVALSSTTFGLPEVKLGVVPGAGGTQRLPRLIGFCAALDMIVSGKSVSAQDALALGLIDAVFETDLEHHALAFVRDIGSAEWSMRVLSQQAFALTDADLASVQKHLAKLPACERGGFAAREAVAATQRAGQQPFDEALGNERKAFLACRDTSQSKALRHGFFAQREAARIPNLPRALELREIGKVGIVGAGTMGTGIAMSVANAGIAVVLQDLSAHTLARAKAMLQKTYDAAVEKKRLSAAQAIARVASIHLTQDDMELASCDLVIEAVFEDLEIKKSIFGRLGHIAKPGAIIASNTSSLDVNVLAACAGREQDVLGMHFFSPAHIMQLLEVVRCDHTAPEVLATVMQLAKRIGKVPVVSGVCFGFIGNRMLESYLREAEFLMLEGASPAFIDQALESFGMAMGPCRMIDMAGVDVAAKVVIEQRKAGMLPADPSYRLVVQALYEQGRHGQKAGKGYYRYDGRQPIEDGEVSALVQELARHHGIGQRSDIDAQEVVERCVYPLIAEGYRILEEGIAYRSGDIDVVWTHGYGFPPYRGGPMFYARTVGEDEIVNGIHRFAKARGDAFGYWRVPGSLARAGSGHQGDGGQDQRNS